MTRSVIAVTPETTIVEAANTMLQRHVSGLPVAKAGKLVRIVSEGDFIRRSEIGTERKRGRFLKFILGPGKEATDFAHEHGRKVAENFHSGLDNCAYRRSSEWRAGAVTLTRNVKSHEGRVVDERPLCAKSGRS
jgi:hypothetical protein